MAPHFGLLKEVEVRDRTGRDKTNIDIGQGNSEERDPSKVRMLVVKDGNPGPQLVSKRMFGEMLQTSTNCVTAGVARSRIQPEKGRVGKEN